MQELKDEIEKEKREIKKLEARLEFVRGWVAGLVKAKELTDAKTE